MHEIGCPKKDYFFASCICAEIRKQAHTDELRRLNEQAKGDLRQQLKEATQELEFLRKELAEARQRLLNREESLKAQNYAKGMGRGLVILPKDLVGQVQDNSRKMREALNLRIQGMPPYIYIQTQFPATVGHIPLREFFEKQAKSLE